MKLPYIVQRTKDTLNPVPLRKDYKALLDLGKTLRDKWALYLTRGVYFQEGSMRSTEPARISIQKDQYKELTEYSIFYNSRHNTYEIKEGDFSSLQKNIGCELGNFVGGFMIKGCALKFLLPQDEFIRYIRAFGEEFNYGYDVLEEYVDLCNKYCSEFNFEYNNEFETHCSYEIHDKINCSDELSIFEWFDINTKIEGCKIIHHKGKKWKRH